VMPASGVVITDLECRLGTRTTAATIARLRALYPGVRFVWLMGADNLVQFHRWHRWRDILRTVPVGVLARPGWGVAARNSVAARIFHGQQVNRGEGLRSGKVPKWCFVNLPLNAASSSMIRAQGAWVSRKMR
jgi:nicotinate-nucleotide adenylyltransferase